MNILHVCQNYYPSVGGPQYTMKHVSEKLAQKYGDDVEVCTTNSLYGPETQLFSKVDPKNEVINNVKIKRHPFYRWHYPFIILFGKVYGKTTGKRLPHSITKYRWGIASPAINEHLAATNADVIMATTIIYNFCDYPFWRNTLKSPKPFVLYGAIHLHKPLQSNSYLIKRAKACDCYIANTDFEKDELVKYGVDKSKIVTIGTGIEPNDFIVPEEEILAFRRSQNISDNDILVGYVGRLVKGKGVAILIDAFRKLNSLQSNIKLLLAGGTTDYVPEIRKAIDEEHLPIILIESFDDKLKPVLYNALDIFVLASQSESFGVVFLEAWSCKKPVVGTRMGAIQSLLSENIDSLLFDAGNTEQLTDAILKLSASKSLRKEMGTWGYKKVIENFTWDKIAEKYRQAYQTGIENFAKNNGTKR